MRLSLTVVLIASLVLAACGFRDSRLNPRNWFGQSREVAAGAENAASANPLIPRRRGGLLSRPEKPDTSVLIGEVSELRIEPTPTGAIVYASGVAARQGAYDARLVPDSETLEPVDGVLNFAFRVNYPSRATAQGSAFSRTVHEAYSISREDLADVRVIRVTAAANARESRRR